MDALKEAARSSDEDMRKATQAALDWITND